MTHARTHARRTSGRRRGFAGERRGLPEAGWPGQARRWPSEVRQGRRYTSVRHTQGVQEDDSFHQPRRVAGLHSPVGVGGEQRPLARDTKASLRSLPPLHHVSRPFDSTSPITSNLTYHVQPHPHDQVPLQVSRGFSVDPSSPDLGWQEEANPLLASGRMTWAASRAILATRRFRPFPDHASYKPKPKPWERDTGTRSRRPSPSPSPC
jgi:hypothetical protein